MDYAPVIAEELQAAKATASAFYAALDCTEERELTAQLAQVVSPAYHARAMHPFNAFESADEMLERFWLPLRAAMRPVQRRMDVFMAGRNEIDGFQSVWVASMGHLLGLFDAPWLGIRPTGRVAMLRYCDFHRIEDGRIAETASFCDIPHLMMQAGLKPFPAQTAEHLIHPGPRTSDGVLNTPQDPGESQHTLDLIDTMVGHLTHWDHPLAIEDELALTWHSDMLWWGPAGIGSTYTIPRYAKQHASVFRRSFADRNFRGHICRFAEGQYGGFFGWPNFTVRSIGGFMGMPATPIHGEFRVIDIYRRAGPKLAENWVFIDLLHFFKQQGVDILERVAELD